MKNVIFKNLLLAFLTLSAVGLSAQTSQTYEMKNKHLFKTFFVNSVNEAKVKPFCQQ